jgi:PAS domain S-box-containing protein
LGLLVESAKDHAIYTMDADGRIDYWNTGAQALFGYTESEITGQFAALFFTPQDRERQELEREMREARERGSAEDERWYVRKDGTHFYASGFLSLLRDERVKAGTGHGYAMIARDLTERITATDESLSFQAHLLDTVEQSVIATDLDGIVTYWNQFARKLYGWTAQEAIGRQIIELTTPEMMAEQALEIMSHLRLGESWAGEFNVQRRDGTTFPVQIINSPISDGKGKLIGIVGVSIDITERKRQEDSLIALTRQLERQSNVFNTTLSSITDFAYIFDRDGLKLLISSQPDMEVVGEADNGRVALQLAQQLLPDVVVMDVSMPELNGLQATKKLKQKCPQVKVLTLTRHTDDGYLQQLLQAGASGYVLKQSKSAELLRAIRAVVAGQTYLDPAITETVRCFIHSGVRGTRRRNEHRGDDGEKGEVSLRNFTLPSTLNVFFGQQRSAVRSHIFRTLPS